MRCLTWNLEWAKRGTKRGGLLQQAIRDLDPHVVCFTEVTMGMVPDGHVIEADPDYGYTHAGDRRKVVLWSKTPWTHGNCLGSPALPSGRFATGVTQGIRFIGVCIPWKDAHVTTGRKDRKRWEDHLAYCREFKAIIDAYLHDGFPICLLGDFNQRIPATSRNAASQALSAMLPPGFTVATSGLLCPAGKALIDHLVISEDLSISQIKVLSNLAADGSRLSDHPGICAELSAKGQATEDR